MKSKKIGKLTQRCLPLLDRPEDDCFYTRVKFDHTPRGCGSFCIKIINFGIVLIVAARETDVITILVFSVKFRTFTGFRINCNKRTGHFMVSRAWPTPWAEHDFRYDVSNIDIIGVWHEPLSLNL